MKCQACNEIATHHVTEIVAGQPVEYHVCEAHIQDLETLAPDAWQKKRAQGPAAFLDDSALGKALRDRAIRQKMAAYLLPALCLALLDEKPEVRIVAAFRLCALGPDARSAMGALRDALQDPDEHVRRATQVALEYIETEQDLTWFF
jgi:HEAT repeat protein